jgi:hypothetical protein
VKPKYIPKVAKPLPNRAALNRLDDSPRTLLDYSKAVAEPVEPLPAVLSLVAKKRR